MSSISIQRDTTDASAFHKGSIPAQSPVAGVPNCSTVPASQAHCAMTPGPAAPLSSTTVQPTVPASFAHLEVEFVLDEVMHIPADADSRRAGGSQAQLEHAGRQQDTQIAFPACSGPSKKSCLRGARARTAGRGRRRHGPGPRGWAGRGRGAPTSTCRSSACPLCWKA